MGRIEDGAMDVGVSQDLSRAPLARRILNVFGKTTLDERALIEGIGTVSQAARDTTWDFPTCGFRLDMSGISLDGVWIGVAGFFQVPFLRSWCSDR